MINNIIHIKIYGDSTLSSRILVNYNQVESIKSIFESFIPDGSFGPSIKIDVVKNDGDYNLDLRKIV